MFFPAAASETDGVNPLTAWLNGLAPAQRSQIDAAARALADGQLVIAIDETAQNGAGSGLMVGVAALATPETVNTSVTWGRGLTCFSVTAERAMALGRCWRGNTAKAIAARSCCARWRPASCTGTGISAEDRALTLRAAGAPDAGIASLKSPGHVMPAMIAYRGRAHRASADIALDLVRHLTEYEVAAWTDILDDDGDIAPAAYCRTLAEKLGLVCLGITSAFGESALG